MNIPYGKQLITDEDINAVVEVLKSDFLTQGPMVERFERDFCNYIGCKYAVAVTNGTAALHLAALALNVKPGDKVLCTTNSFVASANCVLYCGGDIEFVDINTKNFCIDIDLIENKLAQAPKGTYKGIIAVDFAGYPVDFEKIKRLADKYGVWVLEDACHAIGAEFKDSKGQYQKSGNGVYADISVYSFHPVKQVATGEGGMITTNNPALYEKLKLLRTHGITKDPKEFKKNDGGWYHEMHELGFNYRISDILCALGVSQLSRINENIARRRKIAEIYSKELKTGLSFATPEVPEEIRHAYHLYIIQSEKRLELYNYLREHKIFAQVHYIPISTQPFYVEKYGKISMPKAESYYQKALSLPMYHSMSDAELEYVIGKVNSFHK